MTKFGAVIGTVGMWGVSDVDTLIRAIQTALRNNPGDRKALLARLYELRRMKFRAFIEDWTGWYD